MTCKESKVDISGNKYIHISGSIAKHFSCSTPAYIYPLFKTHKLSLQQLVSFPITHFPVRLLQSAGYITTSRITAFLSYLNPISKQFCQFQFNEYCQDSKQYLLELTSWKEKISSSNHLINNDIRAYILLLQMLKPYTPMCLVIWH